MTRIRIAGTVDKDVSLAFDSELSKINKANEENGIALITLSDLLENLLAKGLGLKVEESQSYSRKDIQLVADGTEFVTIDSFESFGFRSNFLDLKYRTLTYYSKARALLIPINIVNKIGFNDGGYFEIAIRRISRSVYVEKYQAENDLSKVKLSPLMKHCCTPDCGNRLSRKNKSGYCKFCNPRYRLKQIRLKKNEKENKQRLRLKESRC